jgi:hypothetical protein
MLAWGRWEALTARLMLLRPVGLSLSQATMVDTIGPS